MNGEKRARLWRSRSKTRVDEELAGGAWRLTTRATGETNRMTKRDDYGLGPSAHDV